MEWPLQNGKVGLQHHNTCVIFVGGARLDISRRGALQGHRSTYQWQRKAGHDDDDDDDNHVNENDNGFDDNHDDDDDDGDDHHDAGGVRKCIFYVLLAARAAGASQSTASGSPTAAPAGGRALQALQEHKSTPNHQLLTSS